MILRCDGVTYTCPMDRGCWPTTVEKHRYCDINHRYHGNTTVTQGGSDMPFLSEMGK